MTTDSWTESGFFDLCQWFRGRGHTVMVNSTLGEFYLDGSAYHELTAKVSGRNIAATFYYCSEPRLAMHRIFADHALCMDKLTTCPLIMKLPAALDDLDKHLHWLASREGYDHSNSYEFYRNPTLPREWPIKGEIR